MSRREQPGARYNPLLTQARAHEQQTLLALSRARQHFAQERSKLEQLQDYQHNPTGPQSNPLPSTLINRNAFLSRLRQAIQMQEQQLAKAEKAIEQARSQWRDANSNTRRFEQLIANEQRRAAKLSVRREQKELDELAGQTHRRFSHGVS